MDRVSDYIETPLLSGDSKATVQKTNNLIITHDVGYLIAKG